MNFCSDVLEKSCGDALVVPIPKEKKPSTEIYGREISHQTRSLLSTCWVKSA